MCPNYSSDPSAAIKELCQVYRDETGTEVEIPIQEYINAFKDAMRPVATRDPAPAPYAREFILRLSDDLRNLVEQSFKSHLKVTDMSRPVQMALFEKAVAATLKAAQEMGNLIGFIDRRNQAQSAMIVRLCNAITGKKTPSPASGQAVMSALSQAERTLAQYSRRPGDAGQEDQGGDGSRKQRKKECWGCGGNHSWWNNKLKKPACPNAHMPGVAEKAAAARKEFLAKRKKRKSNRQGGGGKRVNFDSNLADVKEEDATSAGGAHGVEIDVGLVIQNLGAKALLPVDVHPQLPHIRVAWGHQGLPEECVPLLQQLADSGAACNLLRLSCGLKIIRAYPHICKRMVDCKAGKHCALRLAGVVGSDSEIEKLSTELPVMLEFYTPYSKQDGEPLSIKYACGDGVAVNCVLGMPFWTEVGLVLDIEDKQAIAKQLDAAPFRVTLKNPSGDKIRGIPSSPVPLPTKDARGSTSSALTAVLDGATRLHERYCQEDPAPLEGLSIDIELDGIGNVVPEVMSKPSVTFGDCPFSSPTAKRMRGVSEGQG